MRLVTLNNAGSRSAGVIVGDNILNLSACSTIMGETTSVPTTVRGILEGGQPMLDRVRSLEDLAHEGRSGVLDRLRAAGALFPRASAKLLAPVPDPHLVLSCGMNYRQHLKEMGGGAVPDKPTAFLKSVNAIVGPDAPIVLPAEHPDMVDWEAEFCGVIGKRCHNVSAGEALDYVAGYTMINDVSARNWVPRIGDLQGLAAIQAWDLNLLGKQFPSFCPMGPTIATHDEIGNPDNVRFELKVNGTVMQAACTDDLAFNLAALIAYYSKWHVFQPGDVISTGSPAGVGMGCKPWVFLKAGDVVTLSADGIGIMTNPVVAG